MAQFMISAFADEIDMDLSVQMEVLKQHDIHYIEMRGVNGKNVSQLTLEEARAIKVQLDKEGFSISAVGSPIGKIKMTDDFDEEKIKFVHTLEIAKILETKYIRMFSFFMPEGEDANSYREEVLSRWKVYVELAKNRGIVLLHENEKGIYGDTKERCKDLLDSLGCEYMRATFDPANFVQVGEDCEKAFELLKEDVVYMHIKDALADGQVVPVGYGIGEVESILRQLKEAGYNGFLSLEPHLADFKGFADLEEGQHQMPLKSKDPKERFAIAVRALKDLLNRL